MAGELDVPEDGFAIPREELQQTLIAHGRPDAHLADSVAASVFSTFVFTRTLLPLLTQTSKEPDSDVRIVFVRALLLFETPSLICGTNVGVEQNNRSLEGQRDSLPEC